MIKNEGDRPATTAQMLLLSELLQPYTARVQAKLKVEADKVIDRYNKGLLTFEDLVRELCSIDDAAVYETTAAEDEVR